MKSITLGAMVRPSFLAVCGALLFSMIFASCAPTPAICAPPQSAKRCIVVIGATWCLPCQSIKSNIVPQLKNAGLTVADYRDKQTADVHFLDVDRDQDVRPGWGIKGNQIPRAVVFEGSQIIDQWSGSLVAEDFYRMLGREDLLPSPTQPDAPSTIVEHDESAPLEPVADSAKSTWDQLTEFIGCDTLTLTLTAPHGRKIVINEANAAATMPEQLTAKVKLVGDAVQIDFAAPLIKAEGKRWGIRIGTVIPSVTLSKTDAVVHTGLGIPIHWKYQSSPFGTTGEHPATEQIPE